MLGIEKILVKGDSLNRKGECSRPGDRKSRRKDASWKKRLATNYHTKVEGTHFFNRRKKKEDKVVFLSAGLTSRG